ncbi:hypothetical protein NDU88_005048 [Pleurodeles waltl]|uniref:Uncharacterized protein n=1 Tax=Pleurodeles waltl TaxID=8319 RepID=A0AAV7RKG2_PLEWA|nr:hypothetical protein NDU88_005048 [Pleurodeles waltl]
MEVPVGTGAAAAACYPAPVAQPLLSLGGLVCVHGALREGQSRWLRGAYPLHFCPLSAHAPCVKAVSLVGRDVIYEKLLNGRQYSVTPWEAAYHMSRALQGSTGSATPARTPSCRFQHCREAETIQRR